MGRVVALDPDHRLRVECRAVKNCLIEGPAVGGDLRGALDKPGFLAPQFAMLEGESGVSHDLVIQMPRGEAIPERAVIRRREAALVEVGMNDACHRVQR